MIRFGLSRAGTASARALARSAGAPDPEIRWRFCEGPYFDNQAATLVLDGRSVDDAPGEDGRRRGPLRAQPRPKLETVFEHSLA